MSTNVLLDMEYRGYKIVVFSSDTSTVQIDNPRWGERTYSVHVPRAMAAGMEKANTLQTFTLITASSVMLIINERETAHDIG